MVTKKAKSNLISNVSIPQELVQDTSSLPFQLMMSLERQAARSTIKFPFPVHFLTKA
jgi:hypothetical protein